MAELIRDERRVHPRHQAQGCVGVAGVVLTAITDVQRLSADLNGRIVTLGSQLHRPPLLGWTTKGLAGGQGLARYALERCQLQGLLDGVKGPLVE